MNEFPDYCVRYEDHKEKKTWVDVVIQSCGDMLIAWAIVGVLLYGGWACAHLFK